MYAKWLSRAVSAEKVNIIADEINTAGKVRDDWKSSITQLESASSALINVMAHLHKIAEKARSIILLGEKKYRNRTVPITMGSICSQLYDFEAYLYVQFA